MNTAYIKKYRLTIIIIFFVVPIPFSTLYAWPTSFNDPFISPDTFRSLANHIIEVNAEELDPDSVKAYDIIYFKPEYAPYFFSTYHPRIQNPYILITHDSDYSPVYIRSCDCLRFNIDLTPYLDDPKLIAWFAVNVDYVHPKLIHLPLGIAKKTHPSGYGDRKIIRHALKDIPPLENRSKKIYANFALNTNPDRPIIMNFLAQQSFVYQATTKPRAEYLEEIKQYRYVASPAGNGLDCYRTWEALLVGCIPIMQHSGIDPIFEDLPVILVDRWEDITEEFLEEKYQQLKKRKYKIEKVYADYWVNIIKSFQRKDS
jgi:hypothetical protein